MGYVGWEVTKTAGSQPVADGKRFPMIMGLCREATSLAENAAGDYMAQSGVDMDRKSAGDFCHGATAGQVGLGEAGRCSSRHSLSCAELDRTISTDPPYYDNIGYADLSDFFYVWLRRSLKTGLPRSCSRHMAVPKAEELIASPLPPRRQAGSRGEVLPRRHDAGHEAVSSEQAHPASPVTIYYAFKQSETKREIRAPSAPDGRRSWTP